MNVPNQLTCVRIALSALFPFILLRPGLPWKGAALVIFLAASATDYWDGRLARRHGQITPFGQLMDPIADKLLALGAFFAFAFAGFIPLWTAAVVALRDVIVTGIRFVLPPGKAQEAKKSGKRKTFFQFAYITGALTLLIALESSAWRSDWDAVVDTFFLYGMLAVVAMTVWSGVSYLAQLRKRTA